MISSKHVLLHMLSLTTSLLVLYGCILLQHQKEELICWSRIYDSEYVDS